MRSRASLLALSWLAFFMADVRDGRVSAELVARVALERRILLTELRPSDSAGLEQLFFTLTAAKPAHLQEAAA